MSLFETIISMVLMIFILGVFVTFVVLMGILRAQEFADRKRKERSAHRRAAVVRLKEFKLEEAA
ncbi:MAG: hypothetical protein AAF585_22460 [Verrucomicrobiota bacterium]